MFLILVFIISFIPLYSVRVNPPPDFEVIADFTLSESETLEFSKIKGGQVSISEAIEQVNVGDYRIFTNRLVTSACSTKSNICYAKAIYYFIRDGTTYTSDPQRQYVQSPGETLISGGGDCEDKSLAVAAMLESIGIDADIGLTSNHAFVRAQLPDAPFWINRDEYVWLDPTTQLEFGQVGFNADEVTGFVEVA
jgi:transglutaminase-like putative cysteine protease